MMGRGGQGEANTGAEYDSYKNLNFTLMSFGTTLIVFKSSKPEHAILQNIIPTTFSS